MPNFPQVKLQPGCIPSTMQQYLGQKQVGIKVKIVVACQCVMQMADLELRGWACPSLYTQKVTVVV